MKHLLMRARQPMPAFGSNRCFFFKYKASNGKRTKAAFFVPLGLWRLRRPVRWMELMQPRRSEQASKFKAHHSFIREGGLRLPFYSN